MRIQDSHVCLQVGCDALTGHGFSARDWMWWHLVMLVKVGKGCLKVTLAIIKHMQPVNALHSTDH